MCMCLRKRKGVIFPYTIANCVYVLVFAYCDDFACVTAYTYVCASAYFCVYLWMCMRVYACVCQR